MDLMDQLTHLQKVPVVAFEEGLRLGRVQDIFIDKRAKRIQGISFRSGMWSKEGDAYVDRADILKFGKDVIIVSRLAAASLLPEDMAAGSLRHLKGVKITTPEGAYIGEVVDVNVSRDDGSISEILMTDDQMLAVDHEDVVLGPDVIMVPTGYAERITRLETERHGILARMFGAAVVTDSLRDKYEEIKASVTSGKGEKMFEKTRDTVMRTSRKIQETIEQLRQRREQHAETVKEEGEGYQGTEAEHAGRTYPEPDPGPQPETSYSGPYAEDEGDVDRRPKTNEPQE